MLKILQTSLFALLVVLSYTTQASVLPNEIIKVGTQLVYDVNYLGTNYEFTITVKQNTDEYSFDWYMSAPINKKGTLNLSKDTIENATGIFNYFTNGNISLADQCCIVLSRKMYDAFKNNGSMEIYTDKKNDVLTIFGNSYTHTQSFGYNNDFSNEFDCKTVSDGGDYQITYVNDPNFPLIVEMKLDWSLKLKNIYN